MGITGKLFFSFLGGGVLLFLLIITFFYSKSSLFEEFVIPKSSSGVVSIATNDGEAVYLERISLLDKVYVSQKENSFTITEGVNSKTIELGEGEFFVDIRDINTNYSIANEYFDIKDIGFGKFYIDTRDTENYLVISLNNVISLGLKNNNTEEVVTEVFLYPHMSLSFNPKRNKFLKQADLVRIASVFGLEYYTDSFLNSDKYVDEFSSFLQAVLAYEKEQNVVRKKEMSQISDLRVWSFPGERYIDQYYSLFINDAKKRVYYKNVAFENMVKLLQIKQKNIDLVAQTLASIQKIEPYEEDYAEVLHVFEYLYDHVVYSYDEDFIYTKINFSQLAESLEQGETSKIKIFLSAYLLDSLYSGFDFEKEYSYKNLDTFFQIYVRELGIDVGNREGYTEEGILYLEYFSFFVERIIASRFGAAAELGDSELSLSTNLRDILQVMNGYTELNKIIYGDKGGSRGITFIYHYIGILKNISNFLSVTFFEPERSSDGLLLRKPGQNITNESLLLFTQNINSILGAYEENEKFLDADNRQRDAFIAREYKNFQRDFPEYFLALENYDSYVYAYDQTKKSLLEVETISDRQDIVLNRENLMEYLSQFKFLSFENLQISIVGSRYEVSKLFIQGKEFSFHLSPFSGNKLDNIFINGVEIHSSYKLDAIKEEWKERLRGTSSDTRDLYDFSRFFVNTFSSQQQIQGEIFEVTKNTETEDTVIVVFKRDKLLGNKGEFISLKNNLSIEYDDIQVTPDDENNYSIYVEDAEVYIDGENSVGNALSIDAMISFDYILTNEIHQFQNIALQPYKVVKGEDRFFTLGENDLRLIGNIDLLDFKETLTLFSKSYMAIQFIHDSIARNLRVEQIAMEHNIENQKSTIKFDYGNQNITIHLRGDKIQGIEGVEQEELRFPMLFRSFSSIVDVIK